MRVCVLSGGRSGEHEVSRSSGAAVAAGLREAGHDVVEVLLEREGAWRGPDGEVLALTPGGGLLGADVVFPVLHGPYGEDGTVQGLLELLDVPYVGSGVAASAVCMDKLLFKDLMQAHGLPQVGYVGVHRGGPREAASTLGWPVFVKPARLGSSVGISRVGGPDELDAALDEAFRWDDRVIVEAFSAGIEVEVAMLGGRASVPGEIVLTGGGWYDYAAKYTPGGMELVVPARISEAAAAELTRVAEAVFLVAGAKGLGRCDFFVDGGRVVLNELNTLPGFTATSVYPKLWEASGIGFADLVDRLAALALEQRDP